MKTYLKSFAISLLIILCGMLIFSAIVHAETSYVFGSDTNDYDAAIVNTYEQAFSNLIGSTTVSTLTIKFRTSGSLNDDMWFGIERNGIEVGSTTKRNFTAASCNPGPCYEQFTFFTPVFISNTDTLKAYVDNQTVTFSARSLGNGQFAFITLDGTPVAPTITITFPNNGQFSAGDFTNFRVNVTAQLGYAAYVKVHYSATTTTWTNTATAPGIVTNGATQTNFYPLKNGYLGAGKEYAYAELLTLGPTFPDQLLASSSIISYTKFTSTTNITASSSALVLQGPLIFLDPTVSSSPWFVDCSGFNGPFFSSSTTNEMICGVKKSLVETAALLFKPSENIVEGYSQLTFRGIAPFEYFFDVGDALIQTSTTESRAFPTTNIQLVSTSSQYMPGGLAISFSTSSVETYLPPGFTNTLRTLIALALWITFAMVSYHRMREFIDHHK